MTRTTTTRGVLWEVLAPVVRWPMYSPMRFGLVLVAVLTALLVVGELTSDGSGDPPAASASPGSADTSSEPSTESGTGNTNEPSPHASEPTHAGTERAVGTLARRFVAAYLESKDPRPAWLARLRGMATPELGRSLGTVDRANVAELGRRVVDVEVRGMSATAAAAVVKTDVGELTVEIAHSGQEWQVVRVVPTDPGERGTA